jgi:hypothetical protein
VYEWVYERVYGYEWVYEWVYGCEAMSGCMSGCMSECMAMSGCMAVIRSRSKITKKGLMVMLWCDVILEHLQSGVPPYLDGLQVRRFLFPRPRIILIVVSEF